MIRRDSSRLALIAPRAARCWAWCRPRPPPKTPHRRDGGLLRVSRSCSRHASFSDATSCMGSTGRWGSCSSSRSRTHSTCRSCSTCSAVSGHRRRGDRPDVCTEGGDGSGTQAPPALSTRTRSSYYGTSVRGGYVRQPAFEILGLDGGARPLRAHRTQRDRGRDRHRRRPEPPGLRRPLPGYDFTRNRDGGSEQSDVSQSTMAVLDGNPGS